MGRMIRRLLVANRGEIAVRIVRACRAAAISPVAVYSDADAEALHVEMADAAVRLGPAPAKESYLLPSAIIDAARAAGADAVHPGYGFLSENAMFADMCRDAGLTFVGPPAEAIERMGSKLAARHVAETHGVPVVPGAQPDDQSVAGLRRAAQQVGYPLLLKATAGGGGKGMRVVRADADLDDCITAARGEADRAFGDGTLYIERLLERPRHIEVQVMADGHGEVVHLFERDCSIQRRHQKIIEESPSPGLAPQLKTAICEAACAVARAVGYRNAGTVEFLVEGRSDAQRFYFLEMNTRLQVEHPVTEAACGIDLVRAQFAVAEGRPLPWRQHQLSQRGHAIECRIYAEDPANGFLPQAGQLLWYEEPSGPGIRVDGGWRTGDAVSVHYDPLLAKLIVHDETREFARARMSAALAGFGVLGVRTNLRFLRTLVQHPLFAAGEIDVGFIDAGLPDLLVPPTEDNEAAAAAAAALSVQDSSRLASGTIARVNSPHSSNPWELLRGWRA